MGAFLAGLFVNKVSGISALPFGKQAITFVVMAACAEVLVRVKKSDSIFYSLPVLPNPELEEERKKIVKECLVFDGKVNNYGTTDYIS